MMPRKRPRPRWAEALVAAALPQIASGIIVASTAPHRNLTTVNMRHYGPQKATVVAEGMWMAGQELCHPTRSAVEGRAVYTDRVGASCDMGLLYERMADAGAAALVLLVDLEVPGIFCMRHNDWDKSSMRYRSTTIVDVPSFDVDVDAWRSAGAELTLRISPPHNTDYMDTFRDPFWGIFCLRVLAPASMLWAGAAALEEYQRLRAVRPELLSEPRAELRTINMVREGG